MCGIVGKLDFGHAVRPELLHRMCAAIEHRGPDSRGTFFDDGVGLGVQRLAIIDVAGGDQPIFSEDRRIAVILNGEIYNFEELRRQLVARGHRFSSRSDTEVLVHLYEEHGDEMVTHLRGMFAFAIWDARRRRLFCARDRIGKKPFFWAQHGKRFWFASEIRALLEDPEIGRDVDLSAIAAYLTYQYVPHPLSAFKEIRKLPPASTLVVDADGVRIRRYWRLDYEQKLEGVPLPELEELVWEKIKEATRLRLISEVPLGAFLSGGVDSSAVVAAMAEQMAEPVKTFAIGFADAAFDELSYARLVAQRFGTEHTEFVVEPDAVKIMPKLARHYGEPFGDASAIPSFYLAEVTSRHVTVALNGDGGDESFAGYEDRYRGLAAPRLNWLPQATHRSVSSLARLVRDGRDPSSIGTQARRLAYRFGLSAPERYAASAAAFDEIRRARLVTSEFSGAIEGFRPERFVVDAWCESRADNDVDRMLATDVDTYLPDDLLVKMDIASMAHSVEARSPLLDHVLMEFAATVPPEYKVANGDGKILLKRALKRVVPSEVLTRPKMGFSVPIGRWLREDLRELPKDVLLDPQALGRGYFRRAELEALIREHQSNVADHSRRLWMLIQLEIWHREVVEVSPSTELDVAGSPAR